MNSRKCYLEKKCSKIAEFSIKPNGFDMIKLFVMSNFDFKSLLPRMVGNAIGMSQFCLKIHSKLVLMLSKQCLKGVMSSLHVHCGHQRLFKAHLAVVWPAFNGLRGTQ